MFRIATRVWMVTRNPASRHIRAIDRSLGTGERGARGKKRAQKRGVWRQYRKGRRHGFPESSTTLWRNPITSLANNVGKLLGSWTTYPRNNGLWRLWVLEADLDLGIPSWITFLLAPVPIFSFPTRDLRNNLFYTYCTRVGSPGDHHPAAINQFRFQKCTVNDNTGKRCECLISPGSHFTWSSAAGKRNQTFVCHVAV